MLALSSSRSAAFSATVRVQPARQVALAPSRSSLIVEAAVPKKKTSKSKTAIRKAAWKKEVLPYVEQALFKVREDELYGKGATGVGSGSGEAKPVTRRCLCRAG